jgi:hypothetical protein
VDLEQVRAELAVSPSQSSASSQRTPKSTCSRRTVSGRGETASTGIRGRWAETRRAVRPLRVGTTIAARPSV